MGLCEDPRIDEVSVAGVISGVSVCDSGETSQFRSAAAVTEE
jgi:hypothetical protein